jgi:acyl dehydratase
MGAALFHIDQAKDFIGREIALSDWVTIDQDQVDQFAYATRDPDWMHVDVERSRRESPYRGTIVQGFLMMSLVIHLQNQVGLALGGTSYGLNYGMDRVRFTDVVMVGARVRDRVTLLSCKPKGEGVLMKTRDTLEVEGKSKPGMVADWLVYLYRS